MFKSAGDGRFGGLGCREQRREGQGVLGGFEKIAGAFADVAHVLLVALVAERAEHLQRHHLGKADDGVEGRAQLVIDARHQVGPIVIGGMRGGMAPGANRRG